MNRYTRMTMYSGREGSDFFRPMTRKEVESLASGQHAWFKSIHGGARRVKINGKVRTWKRDLERIEVPIKYGMYEYGTLTEQDFDRLLVRKSESKFAALKEMVS